MLAASTFILSLGLEEIQLIPKLNLRLSSFFQSQPCLLTLITGAGVSLIDLIISFSLLFPAPQQLN